MKTKKNEPRKLKYLNIDDLDTDVYLFVDGKKYLVGGVNYNMLLKDTTSNTIEAPDEAFKKITFYRTQISFTAFEEHR